MSVHISLLSLGVQRAMDPAGPSDKAVSVTVLLTQALRADDRQLLEKCFTTGRGTSAASCSAAPAVQPQTGQADCHLATCHVIASHRIPHVSSRYVQPQALAFVVKCTLLLKGS